MDINNFSYANYDGTTQAMIATCGYASIELYCNYFNELSFLVIDPLNDIFESFGFYRYDDAERRQAYEKAARLYNSLVPDDSAIPVF